MSRSNFSNFQNSVNNKIGEIIFSFNELENNLSTIISKFINSKENDFVSKILLNNSIISFSSKLKIFLIILHQKKLVFKSEDKIHRLMKIRNSIAHSNNLYNLDGDLISEEFDSEYFFSYKIYESNGPLIQVFNKNSIDEKKLEDLYIDFFHLYKDVINEFDLLIKQF